MAENGFNFDRWGREEAVALASRTALRVFPFIPAQYIFAGTYHNGWIIGAFRAAALTYLVASIRNVPREITSQLSLASRDVRTTLKQPTVSGAVRATREACILAAGLPASYNAGPARDNLRQVYRAAHSAVLDISADARSDFEAQYRSDQDFLENDSAQALMATPIWKGSADWFWLHWEAARERLVKGNEHWEFWISWFESAVRAENLHHSIDVADGLRSIPRARWNSETPYDLNSSLSDYFSGKLPLSGPSELKAPKIPSPRPAAIEPIILDDGRLGLPTTAANTNLPEDSISAVLKAVKEGFSELAGEAEDANVDRRSIEGLKKLSERIPLDVPTQLELFRLGHVGRLLDGYAAVVNDEWPDWLANKYHAIKGLFQDTLRQFPRWREFQKNASRDEFSPSQVEAAYAAAAELAQDLNSPEAQTYVEDSLPIALQSLADEAGSEGNYQNPIASFEQGNDELAADVVASLENLAKILSNLAIGAYELIEPILDGAKKHVHYRIKGLGERLGETGEAEGRKDADAFVRGLRKWAKRIILTAPAFYTLITNFPKIAEWLGPILGHLRSLAGV